MEFARVYRIDSYTEGTRGERNIFVFIRQGTRCVNGEDEEIYTCRVNEDRYLIFYTEEMGKDLLLRGMILK